MSTSYTQFAQLISMLNQRVGLTLQACEGACAFLDRQNAYWQLSSKCARHAQARPACHSMPVKTSK